MSSEAAGKRKAETEAVTTSSNKKVTTSSTTCTTKTPYQLYMEELEEFLAADNKDMIGYLLIKGIPNEELGTIIINNSIVINNNNNDDDDNKENADGEKKDPKNDEYTNEQMQSLRVILFDKKLEQEIDKMEDLILGDAPCEVSGPVLKTWRSKRVSLRKNSKLSASQKLDVLIAFTYNAKKWDKWMHLNFGNMTEVVKGLAGAWNILLEENDDEALGWDLEYTKPGVLELLQGFKEKVEHKCYHIGVFDYK